MAIVSENAQKLLEKRYYLRDSDGNLLEHSWDDICRRVSNNVSSAENIDERGYWQNKFYNKMLNMDFIPSSPCLFNAGTNSQQLSSCFIVDIEDNIESIFSTVAECAKIFHRCGGAGFSMHKIRPKGSPCNSSGSTASGVVSFMRIFNAVVNEVKQGNKRNGALKIDLNVSHPEIFEFIHCKDNTSELTNMNISVSITNKFIDAVENDLDWDLKFNGKVFKTVKAKDLWNEIIYSAWKTGEPGLSFQTNMNNGNMNPHIQKDVYGNPCHEFVNIPYTSCNLASFNLPHCIVDNKIDKQLLTDNIETTFRFLDNMVSVNKLPLPKIQKMTELVRPIGMGTMGFGNLLYELKIPYNSQKCLEFANNLYSDIYHIATNYNIKLAKDKGYYPAWENSKWDKEKHIKVRCSSQLSIAPNGSIAFIANTTGGIEPEFALVYFREDNEGIRYPVINYVFKKYLKENNLYNTDILEKISKNNGSIQGLDDIFDKNTQSIFVTANDISPEWHVKVLATIQKYIDLSISKTVNLPSSATKEEISNIYLMAGKLGVKGVTVYRDGSRESQVLSTGGVSTKIDVESINEDFPRGYIEDVPEGLTYRKFKLTTGCGSLYFFLGIDEFDGKIYDCFCNTDGTSGCPVNSQAVSRLLSAGLRGGVPVEYLVKQLDKAGVCPSFQYKRGKGEKLSTGKSCSSAIANVIKSVLKEFCEAENKQEIKEIKSDIQKPNLAFSKCPECHQNTLVKESNCDSCKNCGFSHCG